MIRQGQWSYYFVFLWFFSKIKSKVYGCNILGHEMLRHEYKCLFAYFRNLFIEIFRIVMFILIFYPLELHKVQYDCHTKNNTKAMNP